MKMKLNKETLIELIKEELGKALLQEMRPGYYIELDDGLREGGPYETEDEAREAVPRYLADEARIIKID